MLRPSRFRQGPVSGVPNPLWRPVIVKWVSPRGPARGLRKIVKTLIVENFQEETGLGGAAPLENAKSAEYLIRNWITE